MSTGRPLDICSLVQGRPSAGYMFGSTRLVPILEVETVLFGVLTMTFILIIYASIRPGVFPLTRFIKRRLTRLTSLLAVYATFTIHWALSVKYTWELLHQDHLILDECYGGGDSGAALYHLYGPMLAECVAFGAYTTLIALAVHIFVRKNLHVRSLQVMLAVIFVMYSISLANWAIQIVSFDASAIGPLTCQQALGSSNSSHSIALQFGQFALVSINMLFSDAIVLWRMCVLCRQHVLSRALALLLLLSTSSLAIFHLVRDLPTYYRPAPDPGMIFAASFGEPSYGTAVLSLSLATNVISTSIIGRRAWCYRRDVLSASSTFHRQSVVEKVMTILVESGCIYSIFWILFLVTYRTAASTFGSTRDSEVESYGASLYFNYVMAQLTGVYPTIILVIVALEQSFLENAFSESRLASFVVARAHPRSAYDSHITTAAVENFIHSTRSRTSKALEGGVLGKATADVSGIEGDDVEYSHSTRPVSTCMEHPSQEVRRSADGVVYPKIVRPDRVVPRCHTPA